MGRLRPTAWPTHSGAPQWTGRPMGKVLAPRWDVPPDPRAYLSQPWHPPGTWERAACCPLTCFGGASWISATQNTCSIDSTTNNALNSDRWCDRFVDGAQPSLKWIHVVGEMASRSTCPTQAGVEGPFHGIGYALWGLQPPDHRPTATPGRTPPVLTLGPCGPSLGLHGIRGLSGTDPPYMEAGHHGHAGEHPTPLAPHQMGAPSHTYLLRES